jgi:hypothetical protein
MLWLRSVLRVRPRAISVPLTRNCTELAALDAICRGLSRFLAFRLIGTFSDRAKLHVAHSKDEN